MARTTDAEVMLGAAGFQDLRQLHASLKWHAWEVSYSGPVRAFTEVVVILTSACGWIDLPEIGNWIRGQRREVTIVVRNSAERLCKDLQRVSRLLRVHNVLTAATFLFRAVKTVLGPDAAELIATDIGTEYFVEPYVNFPPDANQVLALDPLSKWLTFKHSGTSPVVALLAPAGAGKTTLARELFRELLTTKTPSVVPLLVVPGQWSELPQRELLSLSDLLARAAFTTYPKAILGVDQMHACLANGAICVIFDGLDELCTYDPAAFKMDAALEYLFETFHEGRILITSRTRFWTENTTPAVRSKVTEVDLLPFSAEQRELYIKRRFEEKPERQEKALNILERLRFVVDDESTETFVRDKSGWFSEERPRIHNIPFVVMLAAESADTDAPDFVSRYGKLFAPEDPLEFLLLAFCYREEERQSMTIAPMDQLRFFEIMASEFKGSMAADDIELALITLLDGIEGGEARQFFDHALLEHLHDRYEFKFEFIRDYLLARVVWKWIQLGNNLASAEAALAECAVRSGSLIDRCASLVRSRCDDWIELCKKRWQAARFGQVASAGFFAFLLRACKDVTSDRIHATELLLSIIGDREQRAVRNVCALGNIHGLDLASLRIENSWLQDIEWISCRFDSSSNFVRCVFPGDFKANKNCEGFELIHYEDCRFSDTARLSIQLAREGQRRTIVDGDQIIMAVRDTLRRFIRGGVGFRSRDEEGIIIGAKAYSAFGASVVETLIRAGVLQRQRRTLRVGDTASVRIFLDNAVPVGSVLEAISQLSHDLIPSPPR